MTGIERNVLQGADPVAHFIDGVGKSRILRQQIGLGIGGGVPRNQRHVLVVAPPGEVIGRRLADKIGLPSSRPALLAAHQPVQRFARVIIDAIGVFADRCRFRGDGSLAISIAERAIGALLLTDECTKLFGLLQQVFAGRRQLVDRQDKQSGGGQPIDHGGRQRCVPHGHRRLCLPL